jgi:hypothetical protein
MNAVAYLIYIVFYEVLILGGTGYAVFVLDKSPWWFLLAITLSMMAYKPSTWIHGENKL